MAAVESSIAGPYALSVYALKDGFSKSTGERGRSPLDMEQMTNCGSIDRFLFVRVRASELSATAYYYRACRT